MRFEGRTALVTGAAARGIGLAITERLLAEGARVALVDRDPAVEETVDMLVAKIPMGRVGTPAEVAALVAWLASDDCTFTTGAVHDLSGGRATY